MSGSAGGHKGVASILDAFQTDTFRRVKLGIGRPDKSKSVVNYVLEPFSDADRAVVAQSCAVAIERVLNLISIGAELAAGRSRHSSAENP